MGGIALAFWIVVVGIWAFVDSFNEPLPELQPVAGIMLVVLGTGLVLAAVGGVRTPRVAAAPMATMTTNGRSRPSATSDPRRRAANPRTD